MTKTSISQQKVSSRHVPQRTCVACRNIRVKQQLIRLVRLSDGSVVVDESGKKAGRGAYLCADKACWQVGLKGNRLEHVLHTTLTPDNREQLISYEKDHFKGDN